MVKRMDTNTRNKLIEDNTGLVVYIVRKEFGNARGEPDDLISAGFVGLVKGTNSFDESKGYKFSTYAATCIRNEILMYLRKIKRHLNNTSLEYPVDVDEKGNELKIQDLIGTDKEMIPNTIISKSLLRSALRFIDHLDSRKQFILKCGYGLDGWPKMTQRQIAARLGIAQSHVSRLQKEALIELRQLLAPTEKRKESITC